MYLYLESIVWLFVNVLALFDFDVDVDEDAEFEACIGGTFDEPN